MPNLMQRGAQWWIDQAIEHASRDVQYISSTRTQTIKAAVAQTRKEESSTSRGRIVTITRIIRIRRTPADGQPANGLGYIAEPLIQVDRVIVDCIEYVVMSWTPVGDSYAKLNIETECVIASERENYRNFNSQ